MLVMALFAAQVVEQCGDKASQGAMNQCAAEVASRADAQLNATWKTVYAAMQKADRTADPAPKGEAGFAQALLESQRAWLRYRDAECRIRSYEWRGGTMQPFAHSQCLADVTNARTKELRALLAWQR